MEGVLHITVKEGRDLPPRDKTGFNDPYCVFIVNGKKHKETTSVMHETNNPKYNEYFTLSIKNSHEVKYEKRGDLVVEVWSWDRILHDSFIGRTIISLPDIPEEEIRKWYPLQSKPKFFHKVHGFILLELWIEWRPVKHSMSAFYRINQKIGAKLFQFGRVGAHYLGRRMLNMRNWGMRTTHLRTLMKQIKPPKYANSKEAVSQLLPSTNFTDEELELLYYAFRSFSYPKEQMSTRAFCQVFAALRDKDAVILAIVNSFGLRPTDDILFSSFAIGLSDVTRGKQQDRFRVISMFFEQAGYVVRERFRVLVQQLLSIFGPTNFDLPHLESDVFGYSERIPTTQFVASLQSLESKEERKHLLIRRKSDAEREGYGVTYCFGVYHYMYEAINEMLEHMMERSATVLKPEKEGFLLKKSGSTWAKFWFCLRNGFLFYYRDPRDCNPARVIFLENECQVIISPPLDGRAETSISFFNDVTPNSLEAPSFENNRGRSQSMKNTASMASDSTIVQHRRCRSNTTGSTALSSSGASSQPSFLSSSSGSIPPHSASAPVLPSLSMSLKPLPFPQAPRTEPMRHFHREFTPLTQGVVFTPPTQAYIPPSNRFSAPSSAYMALDLSSLDSNPSSLSDSSSSISSTSSSVSSTSTFSAYNKYSGLKPRSASQPPKPLPHIPPNSEPIKAKSSPLLPQQVVPLQLDSIPIPQPMSSSVPPIPLHKPFLSSTAPPLHSASLPPILSSNAPHSTTPIPSRATLVPPQLLRTTASAPITSIISVPPPTSTIPPTVTPAFPPLNSTAPITIPRSQSSTLPSSSTTAPSSKRPARLPPASSSSDNSATRREKEQATLRHNKASKKKQQEFILTSENSFQVKVGSYSIVLAAQDTKHRDKWVDRIQHHTSSREVNPFGSFAPARPKSGAKYFIDGRDYFEAIADALSSAREQIFITDWFLSPEIYLLRTPENMTHRLDNILAEKAKEGVKIYIMIWSETKFAMNLNSERAKWTLESLHRNITVICHPVLLMKWSHHQKTVVIDQDIAFLGGLDLCFGRYDIPEHPLEDIQFKLYPGKDYYNPSKGREIDGLGEPFKDSVDRCSVPRMPWHDVSVRVDGYAARDVAKNFIQRWNHHRDDIQMVSPLLIPKTVLWPNTDSKTCQILRSLSSWSGQGSDQTESSICTAMLQSIKQAKHFIYIENQYFISSTAGGKVKNLIGEALIMRIRQAIIEKRMNNLAAPMFRVIVVLPVHPEGTYKDSNSIRYIMKWQYDTICRGGQSILERLEAEYPDETITDYITFHALRNFGVLEGKIVTEQIYVHTKLMIIDDRTVIIGSANINDRSLLGDRDSEIAVIIEDEALVPSKMGGQPYMACKFALSLRLDLWREHLGISVDVVNTILDPISYETYELIWRNTALNNTQLYTSAFGALLEADHIDRVKDMMLHSHSSSSSSSEKGGDGGNDGDPLAIPADIEVITKLTQVQGHLVIYPLHFLTDSLGESFSASIDIKIAGDEVFQ